MRKLNVLLIALTFVLVTGAWLAQAAPPLQDPDSQATVFDPPPGVPGPGGSDEYAGLTGDPDDIIEGNRRNGATNSCAGGSPTGGGSTAPPTLSMLELLINLALQWLGLGGRF
jgi:hypothetical protein